MQNFFVGLAALIERDGKFLILQRSKEKDFKPGAWEAVTGRLEREEEPEKGLLREVKEETKLDVEVIMPIDTGFFYRGGKEFPMVFIAFWVKYLNGQVELSWEHDRFKWVTLDEALEIEDLKHFHKMFKRIKKLKEYVPNDFKLE
ncbi:MAG: NUDIX domain-containing protein [Candidatus Heimdallarchaeaceae archaeon]